MRLAAGILGARWVASDGIGTVVVLLNKTYQAPETRPWWKQKLTIVGLTIAPADWPWHPTAARFANLSAAWPVMLWLAASLGFK